MSGFFDEIVRPSAAKELEKHPREHQLLRNIQYHALLFKNSQSLPDQARPIGQSNGKAVCFGVRHQEDGGRQRDHAKNDA